MPPTNIPLYVMDCTSVSSASARQCMNSVISDIFCSVEKGSINHTGMDRSDITSEPTYCASCFHRFLRS
jgi:hypothetical protein